MVLRGDLTYALKDMVEAFPIFKMYDFLEHEIQ